MARMFNVGVDIYLVDRISRDMMRIGSAFTGAERRVRLLQRSLNELQMRHGVQIQQARTMQKIQRDSDALLMRRIGTMQASLSINRAEVSEAHRLERARIAQLDPLAQAIAMRKQESIEAHDNLKLQREQNALTDVQARRTRLNDISTIRNARLQNTILRDRSRIQERNLELAEAQRAARIEMLNRYAMRTGIALTAAGIAVAGVARAALPIPTYEQQARLAGGFTRAQAAQLQPFALGIAQRTGMFSFRDVMSALPMLAGTFHNFGLMHQVAPSMFGTAAIMHAYGATEDVDELIRDIARTQRSMGARTPAQYRAVNRAIANVYRYTQGAMSPGDITSTMRDIAPAIVRQPFGQGLRFAEQLTLLQGLTGIKGLPSMFEELMLPGQPRTAALRGLLGAHNITGAMSGPQVMTLLMHALPGLNFTQRMMMRFPEAHVLRQLQQAQRSGVFKTLQADTSKQLSVQTMLSQALNTARPAFETLGKALESFMQVIGVPLLGPLGKYATWAASGYSGAAADIQKRGFGHWLGGFGGFLGASAFKDIFFGASTTPFWDWYNSSSNVNTGAFHEPSTAAGWGIPFAPQPVHVTINLDGKKIAHVVAKHNMHGMKQSLMSKGTGGGTLVHSAVSTGNP